MKSIKVTNIFREGGDFRYRVAGTCFVVAFRLGSFLPRDCIASFLFCFVLFWGGGVFQGAYRSIIVTKVTVLVSRLIRRAAAANRDNSSGMRLWHFENRRSSSDGLDFDVAETV